MTISRMPINQRFKIFSKVAFQTTRNSMKVYCIIKHSSINIWFFFSLLLLFFPKVCSWEKAIITIWLFIFIMRQLLFFFQHINRLNSQINTLSISRFAIEFINSFSKGIFTAVICKFVHL